MERNLPQADTIFHNGKVLPVSDDSMQQAVAVHGERILAVGSDSEVLALAGPGTRRVDLRGRTLIPGIVDIHAHMDREGLKTITHRWQVRAPSAMFWRWCAGRSPPRVPANGW